jgi:hypothetical protein
VENLIPLVSVIVPEHISESMLSGVAQRLKAALRSCASRFESIMVNNGSSDSTCGAISELAAKHDWVRGIDLIRNSGQHSSSPIRLGEEEAVKIVTSESFHGHRGLVCRCSSGSWTRGLVD